jgi:hypothetical protein
LTWAHHGVLPCFTAADRACSTPPFAKAALRRLVKSYSFERVC